MLVESKTIFINFDASLQIRMTFCSLLRQNILVPLMSAHSEIKGNNICFIGCIREHEYLHTVRCVGASLLKA